MSNKYKYGKEVPTKVITDRLHELANAVTEGDRSPFVMRVPAEVDYCPDLVISEAAIRLVKMSLLFKEIDDYLNINNQTNIGHGSILHKKVQEFLHT